MQALKKLSALWIALLLGGTIGSVEAQVASSTESVAGLPLIELYQDSEAQKVFARTLDKASRIHSRQGEAYALEEIFYLVHRKLLKKYQPYSSVTQLLNEGTYDCVTGTLLYANLYQWLGYQVAVQESNYHVFLWVYGTEGTYIIEATDHQAGFIESIDAINQHLTFVKQHNQKSLATTQSSNYQLAAQLQALDLFQKISPQKTWGLYFFNQAVVAYHNQNYAASIRWASQACQTYPSPRTLALLDMLIETAVVTQHPNEELQSLYLKQYIAGIRSQFLTQLNQE